MDSILLLVADLIAITLLTLPLYLRRHRRRDLVVAYFVVNIGVLAVTVAMLGSGAGIGLGLGLFGVLSIIRLRSTELAQHEVAYYFAALALGLIGGIGITPVWLGFSLMALIVLVIWLTDHPGVLRRYQQQTVILDRAITDPQELREELGRVLHARVHTVTVQVLDIVNEKTTVEVRYESLAQASVPDATTALPSPAQESVAPPAHPQPAQERQAHARLTQQTQLTHQAPTGALDTAPAQE